MNNRLVLKKSIGLLEFMLTQRGLGLLVLLAIMTTNAGCSCTEKKRKTSDGAIATSSPSPSPSETRPPDQVEKEKDMGVEVPPFTTDKVATIDTTDAPGIFHFKFEVPNTSELISARYKTEYLLVVRANEESCFRLKVRPSAGINQTLSTKDFEDKGVEACAGIDEALQTQQSPSPTPSASASPSPSPSTSLALIGDSNPQSGSLRPDYSKLEWGETSGNDGEFSLAAADRSLCARRLFRTASKNRGLGTNVGLETVVTKTARLVYQTASKKVSVWVDDEFADMCNGTTPRDGAKVAFGPLIQRGTVGATEKDQLTLNHLQTLGDETEKSLIALTTLYGGISDIDGSNGVDVLVSPEINRLKLTNALTHYPDLFRANMLLKPEDLARYNSVSNPTSNEGEILYIWAPDPAGQYLYGEYPTANSLTSNYAVGYLAAQVMTLIVTNKHMLERKDKPMEKMWLLESLALLGSAYRGGNDFSFVQLGHFLTSRPQHLSLTDKLNESRFPPELIDIGYEEQQGLRAFFGWYLHGRLCDNTVNPCDKIKQLIDTDLIGEDNVKAVLGESFEAVTKNFGLSVALGLLEQPDTAKAYWNTTPLPAGTPAKPIDIPFLAEVRASDPPLTYEIKKDASGEHTPTDGSGRKDRTQASPYVTRDTLLFQPLLPDNDIDIKTTKNSVTYILVTGFVDKSTDATAIVGKGLNLAIIPIGERDTSLRQVVTEKVGENAHRDLRPFNLTNTQDTNTKRQRTYYDTPMYPELGNELTVNAKRELWILGSIDNYTIAEDTGGEKEIGDSDAYNIAIDPCDGITNPSAAYTTCRSNYHQVIVQAIPRDFDKQLEPMLLLTSTRLGTFRGGAIFGRIVELDPEFVIGNDDPTQFGIVCQSDISQGGTSYYNCANGGVLPADYAALANDTNGTFAKDKLWTSNFLRSSAFFDEMNWLDNDTFAVTYDNFLFSGPNGYPFYNNLNMNPVTPTNRIGYRAFRPMEYNRQFFNFVYSKDLLANNFRIFATDKNVDFDTTLSKMDDDSKGKLVSIKNAIDAQSGPFAQDSLFVSDCTGFGFTAANCMNPNTNGSALQSEALSYIAQHKPKIICYITAATPNRAACPGYSLTQTGAHTSVWISPNRLVVLGDTQNEALPLVPNFYTTYYSPVEPNSRQTACAGETSSSTIVQGCAIGENLPKTDTDIRRQINIPASRWNFSDCGRFYDDWQVCADTFSYYYDVTHTNDSRPPSHAKLEELSTDRQRDRFMANARRAGEVVGKPKRIHETIYWVKGNQPEIVQILLGGRAKTQGKYVIRIRQKTFDDPSSTWPALTP